MTIRPAEIEDLEVCLHLDHSYLTEYVWQMDVQESKTGTTVNFRTVRLPRPVYVKYPRDRKALLASWHRRDCFLVATTDQKPRDSEVLPILGYLTMAANDWHTTGWISDLVIAPDHRRRGVATQLLLAGREWARKSGLRRLIIEAQTKNHPAMCFLERHGFYFCGFNDRYYANQDIALFFSLDMR